MITIIDYGMGNLGSIVNMFKRIGVKVHVSGDISAVNDAEKILLPGVGAFDKAMIRINESGLREALDKKALEDKVPILGICLGMQLLTCGSEEGQEDGLGWIDARATKIPSIDGIKVPHMGWNLVLPSSSSSLTKDLPEEPRFYFVHSYAVHVKDKSDSILTCKHGIEFDAAIQKSNIYGAQFHPEKSHKFGMQLLKNFASL
ncbi:imidazole glycerol phosphate synthase subunit HisH [Pleionea sp. CnH1-48]|uniref:imidazole glycerol phosphate synthase subunit HisH n=1 Tax=Pleionea sp. CnH1-48 TaxID=2954494 RepID=UPI0020975962|nr:imidazole glycerol phosphate synthase subunit HisH [Pleionea sp. CnH1-48]MCO7223798.1 imidazole glycerol phosphate synthase subunit HisH [Pleionea sp. CnH1-48]